MTFLQVFCYAVIALIAIMVFYMMHKRRCTDHNPPTTIININIFKETDMAKSMEDRVENIEKMLTTLTTTGIKVDLTPVLTADTGIQDTVNTILQQVLPTPPVPDQTPTVTSISPTTASAAGGETITVTGTNLTGATGVLVGTVAGTNVVTASDISLSFTNPAQPAGALHVTVVDAAGTSAKSPADVLTIA